VYEKRLDVSSSADVMEESSYPELVLSDDESSVSSCSIDSTSSRRVSFRYDLVTEVRLRPRTLQKDIRKLFYSYDETQRFRQEYRRERKRATLGDGSTSSTTPTVVPTPDSDRVSESLASIGKHRISHVVVMHKDFTETFFDRDLKEKLDLGNISGPSVTNGSNTGDAAATKNGTTSSISTSDNSAAETSFSPAICKMASDDFFDNDNFWSGQITWY